MLSRVADALFWMSRYLERAEHVARLLDVCFHLEVDLGGVMSGPHELHWTTLAALLQQPAPPKYNGAPPATVVSEWFTFDLDNPSSIMTCLSRSRLNARSIRDAINSEVWRELNTLYWQLQDADFARRARESPHEFYQAVESGSYALQGACDATMTHDIGWQFMQLGKFLERADKTLRIVDVHYHLLYEMTNPADLPVSNLQWAAVLRSCRAYEAHQRRYVGRVEPEHVVDTLLLNSEFPRSVRFSLEAAEAALTAIERAAATPQLSKPARLLGQAIGELRFCELEQVLKTDLHGFLGGILERCNQIARALNEQYSLR
jgi:uncharacterized alpha-E superfamily protein